MYTINTLVFASAGALAALSLGSIVVLGNRDASEGSAQIQLPGPNESASPRVAPSANGDRIQTGTDIPISSNPYAFPDIRLAFTIVFLASFGGMTLELTASRVLAGELGVSLFTWTGIIGVMLAGTALGNLTGGWIADRVNRPGSSFNPRFVLAGSLLMAAAGTVFQFVAMALISRYSLFHGFDPIEQVMGWTFCLFFLPMFALGTISPQVIRLAVPDVAHVGRVAGRVYAWSTTGAILGTFVAGYLLLSAIGMHMTLLCVSLILTLTSLVVTKVWEYNPLLYVFSIVLGGITGGVILTSRSASHEQDLLAQLETNYYTIKVTQARDDYGELTNIRTLTLDHLIHSSVNPNDPFFLYYKHEHVQMEFLRGARKENPNPRVLVVGGGGYTFPRYAMEVMPETQMDVVEIDPGVTWVAKNHLGLKDYDGLKIYHMDGRQYVAEKVPPGTYDLVVQDAVNDLSVPSHLLTKEYNDAVKATLKPTGVYLLTVIDSIGYGKLWKAAMLTLQQTYPPENIALLTPEVADPDERHVFVIYASDRPLDLSALRTAVSEQLAPGFIMANGVGSLACGMQAPGGMPHGLAIATAGPKISEKILLQTHRVPEDELQPYLDAPPRIILTDQYAPVDNLMAEVFRYRYRKRPK
jgi:spermidine synthase